MTAEQYLKMKRNLLSCAGGDVMIEEKLIDWYKWHVRECGGVQTRPLGSRRRDEEMDRKHDIMRLHIGVATSIYDKGLSLIESTPDMDRVRVFVLGVL